MKAVTMLVRLVHRMLVIGRHLGMHSPNLTIVTIVAPLRPPFHQASLKFVSGIVVVVVAAVVRLPRVLTRRGIVVSY